MTASIVSRAVAILLLSVPVGYFIKEVDDSDWEAISTYSHQELLAHLNSDRLPSHLFTIIAMFAIGCVTVASVEALAWLLRRFLFRANAPGGDAEGMWKRS